MSTNSCSTSQCKFYQALTVMQQLPTSVQPSTKEKFKLYGLYKHSLYGCCPNINYHLLTDSVQVAKWESWNDLKYLSVPEAQEEYFNIVLQFLKRFSDRPHIADIIISLERGQRIIEIKSLQPTSFDQKAFFEGEESIPGLDFPKYDGRLSMLRSLPFPEHEEAYEQLQGNTEEFEDSSDDDSSLSTCTIKAYNVHVSQGFSSPNPSTRKIESRLGLEPEKALESLQNQVALLNERLETLKKELIPHSGAQLQDGSASSQMHLVKPTNTCFFRKVILNILIAAIVMAQIFRNRPTSNRILFIQLIFPLRTFLKSIFATFRRMIK